MQKYLVALLVFSLLIAGSSVLAQEEDPYKDLSAMSLAELEGFGPTREGPRYAFYLSHFTRWEKGYLGTPLEENLEIRSETAGIIIDPWQDNRYGLKFDANVTVQDLDSRNQTGKKYPLRFIKFRPTYFWKFHNGADGSVADFQFGVGGLKRWITFTGLPEEVDAGGAVEPTVQFRYRAHRWGISVLGGYFGNINSNQHQSFYQGRMELQWRWCKSKSHELRSSLGVGYFRATKGEDHAVTPTFTISDTVFDRLRVMVGYNAGVAHDVLYAHNIRGGIGVSF